MLVAMSKTNNLTTAYLQKYDLETGKYIFSTSRSSAIDFDATFATQVVSVLQEQRKYDNIIYFSAKK